MKRRSTSSGTRARSIVPALAAAALLAAITISCAGGSPSKWKDGAYQGAAGGMHGDIAVTVTVEKGRISKVSVDRQEETAGVADLALTRVPEQIIKKQTPEVDAVSGSTVTSKAIMAAVQDALAKAIKQ